MKTEAPTKSASRGGNVAAKFAVKHKSNKYVRAFLSAADISVATAQQGAYSLAPGRPLVGFSHPRPTGVRL
jgi:hypothetical protein